MVFNKRAEFYSSNLDDYITYVRKGDLRYLSCVFCVFSEDSPKHKLLAAKILCEFLQTLTCDDIYRIDKQMREMTSIEWSIHWRSFNIEYFIKKQMTEDEKRAVFVFSSFHPNGYIREQAIQSLVKYRNVIPFILLRCNDWVYQVRQSAFYSLSEVLSHCRNEEIIDALPVMTKLFRSKRCEYNNILLLILDFFQKEPNLIKQGLESKDVRVRSFCISILNSQSKIDYLYLRDYILQEKEPFLRKKVFQMLLTTNLPDISLIDLSNIFLKDKYPTNRMLALQYLYDNKKDDIFDIARC